MSGAALKPIGKRSYPANKIRHFVEPGPIVLISSAHKGEANMITCGWYMMMGYDLIGCTIWGASHSRKWCKLFRPDMLGNP